MKRFLFAPAAFLFSVSLLGQCPDNGQTLVLKQAKGMQLVRFFGDASIIGFFPGEGFTWVEKDAHNPDPTFWIGGMLVQWLLVDRSDFTAEAATSEQETLEAYFRYEVEYTRQASPTTDSRFHLERFQFTGDAASDGTKHTFLIWSAFPGGGKTKQYWVATAHPRGIVTMSIIPRTPASEQEMKTLIDSYMASYAILRPGQVNRPAFLGQWVECIHAAAPVPRRSWRT